MTRVRWYLQSLLWQFFSIGVVLFPVAIILAILDDGFLSSLAFYFKEFYSIGSFHVLYESVQQEMNVELYEMCEKMSFVLRFAMSLLIGVLSLRFKFRYAVLVEVIFSLWSMIMYFVLTMQ